MKIFLKKRPNIKKQAKKTGKQENIEKTGKNRKTGPVGTLNLSQF